VLPQAVQVSMLALKLLMECDAYDQLHIAAVLYFIVPAKVSNESEQVDKEYVN
jgi:hypothetical protein